MEKLKIEYVDINSIKPYKNNPRFNDDAVDFVAKSIKEFGFKVPIILDNYNEIIAGHTRYKASLKLGIQQVPCIKANDLSEQQAKAFRLVDNKVAEFSVWDLRELKSELDNIDNKIVEFFDLSKSDEDLISVLEDEGLGKPKDFINEKFLVTFSAEKEKIKILKDFSREKGKKVLEKIFITTIKENKNDNN